MSTAVGIAGRVVGVFVTLATLPILLSYLGLERYGLWLTLTSLVAVLGPLDLGIGNGLTTLIASADGRGQQTEIRNLVATGLTLALCMAAALGVVVAVAYPFIPWASVVNVTSPRAIVEAGPAAAVLAMCFALGIPLGLFARIFQGFQEGYVASAWLVVGNALSLAFLIPAILFGASLPALVLALAGGPLVAAGLSGAFLLLRRRPWLRPVLVRVHRRTARLLLGTGGWFLVLQISLVVGYQLDTVIIAQILGAGAVPGYAIPLKLFMLAPMLLSFALTPLWPAYAEALARRDMSWVSRTLARSIAFAIAVNLPVAAILFVAAPAILTFWVGSTITPPANLLAGLAVWAVLNSLNGPLSMLLVGTGALRFAAGTAVLMAVANITISIVLVSRLGATGAIVGTIIAQLIFILVPWGWYARRVSKRITGPTVGVGGAATP
jgi:O-antigen/teichoic acid export membrane protein